MLLYVDGFEYEDTSWLSRRWSFWDQNLNYGNGMVFSPEIVSGTDESSNTPLARKNGKALKVGGLSIYRDVPKSRTLFLGFAMRGLPRSGEDDRSLKISFFSQGGTGNPAITANILFRTTSLDITWSFSGSAENQYQQLFCPGNPLGNDFRYYSFGVTLYGNNPNGALGWVESRVGSQKSRTENIFTADPEDVTKLFFTGVGIYSADRYYNSTGISDGVTRSLLVFDDLYIANDEGEYFNDFMGDIRIRFRIACADSAISDALPIGATVGGKYTAVTEPMLETTSVELQRQGDAQLFGFRDVNFAGSEPRVYGAVISAMAKTSNQTPLQNTSLTFLCLPQFSQSIMTAKTFTVPVQDEVAFFQAPILNTENVNYDAGITPQFWNTVATNFAEFGVRLEKCPVSKKIMEDNCPTFYRHSVSTDILVEDNLETKEFVSRHFEGLVSEILQLEDENDFEWTFGLYEDVLFSSISTGAKGRQLWLNSVVYLQDKVPWTIEFINDVLSVEDQGNILWSQFVVELLYTGEFTTGFWVEEFRDGFRGSCLSGMAMSYFVDEILNTDDSPKTNMELVNDSLVINSSYIFSGHELLGETLYPDDFTPIFGWGMDIEDDITITENHFDGHWVERMGEQNSITDTILTQHWRHETSMGVIIHSAQIDPVEQEGDDGYRVGELTSEYWQSIGYTSNPTEN